MNNFGLYIIITNPIIKHTKIAEVCVKYKIKMIQLREKSIPDKEIIKIAKDIRKITNNTDTNFVVNDRLDIATIVNADYIHIGQDDIAYEDIRRINKKIKIGISNHSIKQLKESLTKNYNYYAFGPIFKTPTKPSYKEVGLSNLKKAVKLMNNKPLVAIGGIFDYNLDKILTTGVKNFCMVRYFMESKNISEFEDKLKKILDIIHDKK
ncbi:MAG: thiamine phosphate synthase [Bacteroidales bacterium]|nr:thiamine phosphate synthase [Bacteroidales bacterium]